MSAAGVLPKGTGRRRNLRTQARADKGAKSVAVAAERSAGGKADFFLSPQGLSQIEVAFEIEGKGIMDKGIGKSEKITTNDRRRLTEEQIAKMFLPEQFADEDRKLKVCADAKNTFDGLHATRGASEGSNDWRCFTEK